MFGLNARRRRCSKSRARARSNKRGLSGRQPNGRDAKNVRSLEAGRGVAVGLYQPRWLTHHASLLLLRVERAPRSIAAPSRTARERPAHCRRSARGIMTRARTARRRDQELQMPPTKNMGIGDREAPDGGHDFVGAIDERENDARDGEKDRRREQHSGKCN